MRESTDYIALSAMLHARETLLLTKDRRERMLNAANAQDALKVLGACGYELPQVLTLTSLEQMLAASRAALYSELLEAAPDRRVVELFALKYDYHNAKVMLKGGNAARRLLMDGGRYLPTELADIFAHEEFQRFTPTLREGIEQAQEELSTSGDAQRADLLLDRAYFAELTALASDSAFLREYVALLIDTANLRIRLRLHRIGRESGLLPLSLLEGGSIPAAALVSGGISTEPYRGSLLAEAAELAAGLAASGGSLTAFERACDDAINEFFDRVQRIPYGEEVLSGYLHAREAEWTAIRTILSGKLSNLDADTIRARLRRPYC